MKNRTDNPRQIVTHPARGAATTRPCIAGTWWCTHHDEGAACVREVPVGEWTTLSLYQADDEPTARVVFAHYLDDGEVLTDVDLQTLRALVEVLGEHGAEMLAALQDLAEAVSR